MIKANVKIKWNDAKALRQIESAIKSALEDSCEYILQETNKVIPLDEGTLLRSGDTQVEMKPKPKGVIYYDTPYAVRLHEHPEYNYQNHRKGKYLEDTLKNERNTVKDFFTNRLGGAI